MRFPHIQTTQNDQTKYYENQKAKHHYFCVLKVAPLQVQKTMYVVPLTDTGSLLYVGRWPIEGNILLNKINSLQ